MQFVHRRLREASNLRGALWLCALGALLLLLVQGGGHLAGKPLPGPWQDLLVLAYAGVAVWIMTTLWIAFRRWRSVSYSPADLQSLVSGLSRDLLLVVSPDRRIVMCGDRVRDIFGYEPDEVLGQSTQLLYEDRRGFGTTGHPVRDQLNHMGFHVGQAVGRTRTGERIPLEIVTGHMQGKEGAIVQIRDVTELMKVEDQARAYAGMALELEETIQKLRQAESSRDSLLQMIVHDMKTPLQVILGNVEMMTEVPGEGWLDEDVDVLQGVAEQTRRLVGMVNSILDISRLEAGEMPLLCTMNDMAKIANQAREAVSSLAGPDRILIKQSSGASAVYCDAAITQRVAVNLLSNAIRHSPPNEKVVIEIKNIRERIRFSVIDQGEGIPADLQAGIFEKFAQVGGGTRRGGDGGSGIGLAFCKLAVEAQKGHIGLTSQKSMGSTFWFELPNKA